uniref:M23 family metallopeptidase n=1 Tax=Desertifilum tharense IPPAS B-1220 TaxID=1781255 RepID=A0ACD5H2F0_9CYAN
MFASQAGVVIFAGWYGGYGNSVILDHGNGITTLYAHASELFVQEGQTVQGGEAIATVGSTGLSTGPHLHFEVRENGEPVDPMNYLS